MAGDQWRTIAAEAKRCGSAGAVARRPVQAEIGTTHARRLDFDNDLAGTGCRIGEFHQIDFSIAGKYDATHGFSFG
jgi:hypothetical protein